MQSAKPQSVNRLFPFPQSEIDLAEAYAFPVGRSWVRAIFVASIDGAATVDGRSGGLGNETDRRIFALQRALADVVLVGAGTARAEGYGPAEIDPEWQHLRQGRTAVPPIAVVTGKLDLDLDAPLFADAPADARTIILTTEAVPEDQRAEAATVADVIVAGEQRVEPKRAVAALAERGLLHVTAEGGPTLLSGITAADCLDELSITRSPILVSGSGTRITHGPTFEPPCEMRLTEVLATDDSYLYLRYIRA